MAVATGELFTPLAPEMLADPYPVYAQLRTEDPVHWHDALSAWVVTRHDDGTRVLKDSATFGSDPRVLGKPVPESVLSLQTLDPPAHTAVRHLFLDALRRMDEARWAADVTAFAHDLLSHEAGADGVVDFVSAIAEPVALKAMCTAYGIPYPAEDRLFRDTSRTMILGMDAGLDPTRREPALAAREVLNDLILSWRRDAIPPGVLATVGANLPDDEQGRRILLNSLRAVFDAGYSTTSNMLSNAVMWLANRAPAADLAVADGRTVDELIRLEGPVQAVSRHCLATVELRGRTIRHGDVVVVVLAAANHDPAVFPNPGVADLARDPNPHLGLGRGVHSCLGGRLGRRVLLILLHALAAHANRIEPAGPLVRRPTATQRGLDRLPVHLHRP